MTARSQGFSGGQGGWGGRAGVVPLSGADDARAGSSTSARLTGIGVTLRDARESAEISFELAERDTRIPRHHLQALEEERFDAFSAPVYIRGFLRSYSQYLKLDSSELLSLLPPDAPLEEERLLPLSRLGRPRGPREAARARRDPLERDAPPLTADSRQHMAREVGDGGSDARSGRMRLAVDAATSKLLNSSPRLDPLGRLGWPVQPGGVVETPNPIEETQDAWDQPLSPRRSRHWNPSSRWQGLTPEDMRPFFGQRSAVAIIVAGFSIALLLAGSLILGGGDVSPELLASTGTSANSSITIPVTAGQSSAHGSMPSLLGTDLLTALTTLRATGVVPVVLQIGQNGPNGQAVQEQVPAAGSHLDPGTPVLLVAGGG